MPLRTQGDHHPAHFTGLDQRLSGKAHVIGLAESALHEGAKLFLVRFHQLNITDVQRGGQRIAGTVNDAAQSLLLRIFTSCIRLSTLIRRQAAADHQQRAGFDNQNLLFQTAEFIVRQCRAGHNEAILFAAGGHVDVQVLPRPVAGFDGLDRHLLIGQQGGKMLAGSATDWENGGGFAAEKGHGAGHVDPAAASSNTGALQRSLPSG